MSSIPSHLPSPFSRAKSTTNRSSYNKTCVEGRKVLVASELALGTYPLKPEERGASTSAVRSNNVQRTLYEYLPTDYPSEQACRCTSSWGDQGFLDQGQEKDARKPILISQSGEDMGIPSWSLVVFLSRTATESRGMFKQGRESLLHGNASTPQPRDLRLRTRRQSSPTLHLLVFLNWSLIDDILKPTWFFVQRL
ncbi:hypothetical protein ACRALDRAFT_207109 [Sodiomyces alcalophilus JCM 7366]|uniref:uncharacterized protein n=1 Tax=Sodiomyces alcalophilus JCM 7366 TaxID=591952 RepID=UPI0039B4510F